MLLGEQGLVASAGVTEPEKCCNFPKSVWYRIGAACIYDGISGVL
jgi:hypothetical protein